MSHAQSGSSKPWFSAGRFSVSPLNFAPAVRAQMDFPAEIRVYDSTLRKMVMTPGVRFRVDDAFRFAEQLQAAGIRHIFLNIHFWGSKAPETLSYAVTRGVLQRFNFEATVYTDSLMESDWERRVDCLLEAGAKTVQIELPTSDIKRAAPGAPSFDALLDRFTMCADRLHRAGAQVSVGALDAGRTDFDRLTQYLKHALQQGAIRVDLSDSPGSLGPEGMKYFILRVREQVGPDMPLTMHVHNDCGMADASALAALTVGCWPDAALNGLSYRAGFASTEVVVGALETLYGVKTGIDTTHLSRLSETVAALTLPVQPHRAFCGSHAFVKEAPPVVAGVLRNRGTSALPVDSVVAAGMFGRETHVVWGRQTLHGQALVAKLEQLGMDASPDAVERVREVLIRELDTVQEYPYWLEDEQVSAICRKVQEQ